MNDNRPIFTESHNASSSIKVDVDDASDAIDAVDSIGTIDTIDDVIMIYTISSAFVQYI